MWAGLMLFLVLGVSGEHGYLICQEFDNSQLRGITVTCSTYPYEQSCVLAAGRNRLGQCATLCIGETTLYSLEPLQPAIRARFTGAPGQTWFCDIPGQSTLPSFQAVQR
jgi:hypothetical protein